MTKTLKKLLTLNKTFNKEETRKCVDWFLRNYGSSKTAQVLDSIKQVGFRYATVAGTSIGLEDFIIPLFKIQHEEYLEKRFIRLQERVNLGYFNSLSRLKKLNSGWKRMNGIIEGEVRRNLKQYELKSAVYLMVSSGARGNLSQVKQLVGMRGFFVSCMGTVTEFPVKSNLTEGLKVAEYFTSCYGARKGIIDTALKTADAGYLTRRLVYAAQSQVIKKTNCFSKNAQLIFVPKDNKEKYTLVQRKLIGRVIAKNIFDPTTSKIIASEGQDICKYVANKIIHLKTIYIRTTFNCKLTNGLCQLCYGWNLGSGRMVDLGEAVGVVAAQSIGEPGTQLTMRTFHTGGVFTTKEIARKAQQALLTTPHAGIINYNTKNGKKFKTRYGESIFLTLKPLTLVVSDDRTKIIKSAFVLPTETLLFVKPNQRVYFDQTIGKLKDSVRKEIPKIEHEDKVFLKREKEVTPVTGLIYNGIIPNKVPELCKIFKGHKMWIVPGNIVSYNLFFENITTSVKNKVYLDFNTRFYRNKNLNKKLNINFFKIRINYKIFTKLSRFNKSAQKKEKDYKVLLNNAKTNELFLTDRTEQWINVKNNIKLTSKLGNIILKDKNLYDNIKNKYHLQVIEIRKNKMLVRGIQRFALSEENNKKLNNNRLINSDFQLSSETLYKSEKEFASDIVQGLPKIDKLFEARKPLTTEEKQNNPNEILKNEFIKLAEYYENSIAVKKAFEKVQDLIIDRIQIIYREQKVNISDKHIEIIVKQMTSKALILGNGDSNFLVGEIIDVNRIEKVNQKLKNKIKYEPVLIGISKVALSNASFLSQASFQETTRVLARSAIEGKIDWLDGLKENLILGNLIPIGTGFRSL